MLRTAYKCLDVRFNMDKSQAIESAREIDQLFYALTEDVKQAAALWTERQDDFSRRTYIKTCFSLVEGLTQIMKSACLLANEYKDLNALSPEEIVLLREELAYVKQNGHVGVKSAPIGMAANFRFATSCCNKIFNLNHELNAGGNGWVKFIDAIKIRDKITHPHKLSDINISEEDMDIINEAMDFFREETIPFVKCKKI